MRSRPLATIYCTQKATANHGPAEFINPQNARNFANSSISRSYIYAEVVADGRIADGDTLQVTDV